MEQGNLNIKSKVPILGGQRLLAEPELAGVPGFEPGHGEIKIRCLTAWLHPSSLGGDGVIRVFRMGFKGEHEHSASRT